jgi:hypothetical protein
MDVACGLDPGDVTTHSPRIIGVQLPSAVTADPSGGQLAPYVIAALIYIIRRADQVAAKEGTGALPIVVNLSYGLNHGPHDGTSLLERAIDAITQLRRASNAFTVVLPVGNSQLTRCHARFSLDPGAARTLPWRVLPDDATPSFLDIWLPANAQTNQVEVEVKTPVGTTLGVAREGDGLLSWASGCTAFYPKSPGGAMRNLIWLALLPTTTQSATDDIAPSGTWRVAVSNVGSQALDINAWIWRDDTPMGFPIRGRQSRFDDPDYERFDDHGRLNESDTGPSYVKRDGSINGIATGRDTVVMGGWRHRGADIAAAPYSASGPILAPVTAVPPPRPDAAARSEHSDACHGILAAGTRSRTVVAVDGTSVAAPQAARVISALMVAGSPGDRAALAAAATAYPPPKILEKRGGKGFIDPQLRTSKVERSAPV